MLRIPRPGRRLRPDRPGRGIAWTELDDPKLFEGSLRVPTMACGFREDLGPKSTLTPRLGYWVKGTRSHCRAADSRRQAASTHATIVMHRGFQLPRLYRQGKTPVKKKTLPRPGENRVRN